VTYYSKNYAGIIGASLSLQGTGTGIGSSSIGIGNSTNMILALRTKGRWIP